MRSFSVKQVISGLAAVIVVGGSLVAGGLASIAGDSLPGEESPVQFTLATPLGKDVLLLTSMTGYEALSDLFRFELDMVSEDVALDPRAILGQKVTIRVDLPEGGQRYVNGHVSRFTNVGPVGDLGQTRYTAEVVPQLWFLTRTTDSRIFQDMTIPQVIEKVFLDGGLTSFEMRLPVTFQPRDYVVQYRETDFNFVSRLMEEEGIFYYFEHEDGEHTLVLTDSTETLGPLPQGEVLPFLSPGHETPGVGGVTQWEHQYEFRSGKWAHTDYNFETPSVDLSASAVSGVALPDYDKYELYDYPGGYATRAEGERLAQIRMEEEDAQHIIVMGTSEERHLTPGFTFVLEGHPVPEFAGKYLITSVTHQMSGDGYKTAFTALPNSMAFRPARITRKPVVQGPQTAIVTGPTGEEIYTDKYGRVKVQFHWDREGKKDENSSGWVRVSQMWAGEGWGMLFIPRIGQEVIVDFLEGDPDRPIILGRVYNSSDAPPSALLGAAGGGPKR
ncbi:MAG: type VI secretion system tip protein VgrG [Chloroflexi bacterium]|nr:type VI secretion system tip protein VgrG [Chloroflexota bacterium]